jgi:hypothetical protein
MKRILFLSFMILGGHIAFSQSPKNDPTYSENNYKHPNKAVWAKEHKTDKSTEFTTGKVEQNDNYKQQFNQAQPADKVVIKTKPESNKNRKSYKHPYGL